jgi:hypothetical protein
VNEIVKEKGNKEVDKPNNFKRRFNNFENAAQKGSNELKKVVPPKNLRLLLICKKF